MPILDYSRIVQLSGGGDHSAEMFQVWGKLLNPQFILYRLLWNLPWWATGESPLLQLQAQGTYTWSETLWDRQVDALRYFQFSSQYKFLDILLRLKPWVRSAADAIPLPGFLCRSMLGQTAPHAEPFPALKRCYGPSSYPNCPARLCGRGPPEWWFYRPARQETPGVALAPWGHPLVTLPPRALSMAAISPVNSSRPWKFEGISL